VLLKIRLQPDTTYAGGQPDTTNGRHPRIWYWKRGYSRFVPSESQAHFCAANAGTSYKSICYENRHFRPIQPEIAESAMMNGPMPSPIGHALAGVATAWLAESFAARTPDVTPGHARPLPANAPDIGPTRFAAVLTLTCVLCAVVPDIDLVYLPFHRTATHSVTAVALTMIIAAGVTGWVTRRTWWRIALVCGLAYATHLLLDWAGADASPPYGIQAFWPFSARWFISPWIVFPGTERRDLFTETTILINVRALVVEVAILGPVAAAAWFRRTRKNRVPISARGVPPPPSV
jgi:inner membrane protein